MVSFPVESNPDAASSIHRAFQRLVLIVDAGGKELLALPRGPKTLAFDWSENRDTPSDTTCLLWRLSRRTAQLTRGGDNGGLERWKGAASRRLL
jgi:hypothetical protein